MHIQLSARFALDVQAEAGETSGRREISGLAAPYQVSATVSGGIQFHATPSMLDLILPRIMGANEHLAKITRC